MILAVCDGNLVPQADGSIICDGLWQAAAYVAPFTTDSLDVGSLWQTFGTGLFLSLTVYGVIWASAQVVRAIRVL